jgi:hypothetical protein
MNDQARSNLLLAAAGADLFPGNRASVRNNENP